MTLQHKYFTKPVFLFVLTFIQVSCVSVSIKAPETSKAKDFSYEAPASPFSGLKTSSADHAWQSSKTGNTFAILTECNSQDPSLEFLQNENLNALSELQILSSKKTTHQSFPALETEAEGVVDGISLKVLLISIKKETCSYLLTFVGRQKLFQSDLPSFQKFRKGFQIK